jgi:threonine/homoserine/homoserine lactone efflux protein
MRSRRRRPSKQTTEVVTVAGVVFPIAAIGLAWFASATVFAVSMSATPGPNNTMLASSGSLWGFRRTIPHILGVSLGFSAMLIAVAAGLGGLLLHHPTVLGVLRWIAVVYLLYLAWRIATAKPHDARGREAAANRGRPLSFTQAALFQWVNPKAWVIALSALATMTAVADRPSFQRAVALALLFLAATLVTTALWAFLGVGVSRVLRSGRALQLFNVALAVLLVLSVVASVVGVG